MTKKRKRSAKEPTCQVDPIQALAELRQGDIEHFAETAKHIDSTYVRTLVLAADLLIGAEPPKGASGSVEQQRNAVRGIVAALSTVDPGLREVVIRLAAELEATGANETRH